MVKEVIYERVPFVFLSLSFIIGLFFSFYEVPFWILIFFFFLGIVFFFKKIIQSKSILIYPLIIGIIYTGGKIYYKYYFFKKEILEEVLVEIKEIEPWYNGSYIVYAFSKKLGGVRFKTEKLEFFPGQNCLIFLSFKKSSKEYLNPFFSEKELRIRASGLTQDWGFLKKNQYVCSKEKKFNLQFLRLKFLKFSEKLEPLARGLFQALVLGVEVNLPQEYKEKLKTQGIYHNLAISGFNLAVLYIIFYKISKMILTYTPLWKVGYPIQLWSSLLALPGAFLILLFSGFCPSALRAFTFLFLFVIFRFFWIKSSPLIIFLLGITLILIFEPYLVGNLSFQLSVVSTLGVILGYRIFNSLTKEAFNLEIPFKNFILKILLSFFVSLIVSFFTFPFLIYYTGAFPIFMPINNLIATPFWSFIFIPFSILGAFISFLNEELAIYFLNFLAYIFKFYTKIPLFECTFNPDLPVNLILLIIFLSLFLTFLFKKFLKLNFICFYLIILIILYFLCKLIYNSIFLITVFDVGKANAILLKTNSLSNSNYILFDTGPNFSNSSFNWTETYLVNVLRKMGVNKLDLVIISHPDLDHSGGLVTLKEKFLIKKVLSGNFEEKDWEKSNLVLLPEKIVEPQVLKFPSLELFLFSGKMPYEDLNRESLVVYVEHSNGLTFLLPGDIDIIRFYRMKERREILPVEILLAPHHGSLKGLNKEILIDLKPETVIISGRGMYFPHPEVVKLLDSMGIFWVTTEKEGALFIFPKKEYFLICSEKEKRKNFLENWLFPLIPVLIEVDHCLKFAYHKN